MTFQQLTTAISYHFRSPAFSDLKSMELFGQQQPATTVLHTFPQLSMAAENQTMKKFFMQEFWPDIRKEIRWRNLGDFAAAVLFAQNAKLRTRS